MARKLSVNRISLISLSSETAQPPLKYNIYNFVITNLSGKCVAYTLKPISFSTNIGALVFNGAK